ncbi:MAG TPA: adenosylcobinamide-GDP ribazoletransferase [Candidatus Binataceae bacterium]|nr:adenosylcobinamide-GDP ribazoletransferase [Candidatus Binataceae bacterium]
MNEPDAGDVERRPGSESFGPSLAVRVALEIRLALGFLTILPVLPRQSVDDESVAGSLRWFPLVGFALGGILSLEDLLLRSFLATALRSALLILSLAVLTGAVHLDGLADTADAFGAGRDRTRALEILRDSRIGSFGAIALFFVLALKILALSAVASRGRYLAICFVPAMARWAMVAVSYRLDYLRNDGAGAVILAGNGSHRMLIASATVALAIAMALSAKTLIIWAAAALAVILIRAFYVRWLGGVTGDLIGAAGEVIETLVLVAMSI